MSILFLSLTHRDTHTLNINTDSRHKHVHSKVEWAERVWVKSIEISVVTAGQLRGSDKQPTVREDRRPIALKQTLSICTLYQIGKRGPISIREWVGEPTKAPLSACARVFMYVWNQKTVGIVGVVVSLGWGGCSEYTAAEHICSIHSLRNRSRILPACVATCQNLSS